jgi:hypothetical protein
LVGISGVAGAVVVDGRFDAELADAVQRRDGGGRVPSTCIGGLDAQLITGHAEIREKSRHAVGEAGIKDACG